MTFEQAWLQTESPETRIARHVLRAEVLDHLKSVFRLDWQGIHGVPHWARVMRYGLRLAMREGGDPWVVAWFAVLHDHQRWNEGRDRDHGIRAAEAMGAIADRGWFSDLSASQIDLITEAIRHHSDGWVHSNSSIGACWDADRLDLVRLGIAPSHGLLSTNTAKKMASVHTQSPSTALKHRLAVVSGGGREAVEP
jgi:uncharacterized protein